MMSSPQISVVIPVRRARKTIGRTLEALLAQRDACQAEVIVAVSEGDACLAIVEAFQSRGVRILVGPPGEGIPQLRRNGVFSARAPYVAITEDHCTFPDGWLMRFFEVLSQTHAGVAGGPVSNGRHSYTGWAQYFTRYTAFLPGKVPAGGGPARALPGNTAVYSRAILDKYRHLLKEGFWEAEFNHALMADGVSFWIDPGLAVEQHQVRGTLDYLALRYRHGRCYGWRRFQGAARSKRWRLLAGTPAVPLILYARAIRSVLAQKEHTGFFLLASPLLFCYYAAWSLGEAAGYVSGAGDRWWDTD